MDDVIADIAGIPNALLKTINRRKAQEIACRNPSPKRIVAHALFSQWLSRHPEEHAVRVEMGVAAAKEWRKVNPGKAQTIRMMGTMTQAQNREDNPEEYLASRNTAGLEKYRKERREEFLANTMKMQDLGGKAFSRKAAEEYSKRFAIVKPFIPESGISTSDLHKLFPKWNRAQVATILRRAVKCGDVVYAEIKRGRFHYYLPKAS